MKWNLPNKLTVLRVILIPVFVTALMIRGGCDFRLRVVALAVFIIAALTDMLDGMIARKYHLITTFGKFMDPLADKLLVCAALVCFVELKELPAWIVIIIISREFIISGFRLIAAEKGNVIAAGWWGKCKTVSQMITTCLLILNLEQLKVLTDVCIWIMVCLTIVSLLDYLVKNKSVLHERSL